MNKLILICRRSGSGKTALINLDYVYGNYYGSDKNSLLSHLNNDRIVIKEVHPSNCQKLIEQFPDTVIIYICCNKENLTYRDQQHFNENTLFFESINIGYNLIFNNNYNLSLEDNAMILHKSITELYNHKERNAYNEKQHF